MNIAPENHFENFWNCFPDPFMKSVKNLLSTAVSVNDYQRMINSFQQPHQLEVGVGCQGGTVFRPGAAGNINISLDFTFPLLFLADTLSDINIEVQHCLFPQFSSRMLIFA